MTAAVPRPPAVRLPAARVSVLHVVVPAETGGLETVVQALVTCGRRSGVDARVAAVGAPGMAAHPFLTTLRAAGVEVFTIETPGRGYFQERAAVAGLCRMLRPDVVHTHGYRADVVDAPVARRLGIPVVSTLHGFMGGDRKNRFYQWLQRRTLRRFDAVIAVSRWIADDLARSGVPRDRIHYVQNACPPVDPLDRDEARDALRITDQRFRIGWVGRLSPEKAPDVLIDALRLLADLPVAASVVGIGPLRQPLGARAAALHVAERIHWHDLVPGAGRLLRAFDVVALTSRVEGTPVVLLEAMAAGVPIVASAVGGVPDMVSSAEALLVPAGTPGAVAGAIREVLRDPAGARRRAHAARARVEQQFGLTAWLKRYEAVYHAVRQGHPLSSREPRQES